MTNQDALVGPITHIKPILKMGIKLHHWPWGLMCGKGFSTCFYEKSILTLKKGF